MSVDFIKYASVAGEVSPNYYGRGDLEKYDLALAECENFFVDYRGGISNSPGSRFAEEVQFENFETKFFAFQFSSETANTNIILFGKGYIRFLQAGAYVLEDEKPVSDVTIASPGVVTCINHGYVTDDLVQFTAVGDMKELVLRTFAVRKISDNTFALKTVYGDDFSTLGFTAFGGTLNIARIYTLASPYDPKDLELLKGKQIKDFLRLTHKSYKTMNLVRKGQTDWVLEEEIRRSLLVIPAINSAVPDDTGAYCAAYAVTQVDIHGEESLPSDYYFVYSMKDIENTDHSVVVTWPALTDASYYNVYRTRIVKGNSTSISRSFQLGYLGQSKGGHFVDTGITPDFAKTPPQGNDPFQDGRITQVNVILGGTGYDNASIITVTDPNPDAGGFLGYPVIATTHLSTTGPIVGVVIINEGYNYTNPTFTVTGGAGVLMAALLGPSSGNNPAASTIFQQREVYAGQPNKPLTMFGSKPGQLSNFNVSDIVIASDSYEHEIDSENASAIRHLVATRGGILAFSPAGFWLISGSSGAAITATDVQADFQSVTGSSNLPPLKTETDVLYENTVANQINACSYDDRYKLYTPTDVSILANHLFGSGKRLLAWTIANEPQKLIWAVRSDGVMLNFTMLRDQNVFAWTRRTTQGSFLDVVSVVEDTESYVYLMARRFLGGRWRKIIEVVAKRNYNEPHDAFFVDCGLSTDITYPDYNVQVATATGNDVSLQIDGIYFTAEDVGRVIRAGGGLMEIVNFVNGGEVTVNIIRPITDLVQLDGTPALVLTGTWSITTKVTEVSGLWHLEGKKVSILADGLTITGMTVVNGKISLPQPASRVHVGLPYRSLAKNLPLTGDGKTVIEHKRKRAVALAIRVHDTGGIKAGSSLDKLYTVKGRPSPVNGLAPMLMDQMTYTAIEPVWGTDVENYIVQDLPLPVTILGIITETDIGDEDAKG